MERKAKARLRHLLTTFISTGQVTLPFPKTHKLRRTQQARESSANCEHCDRELSWHASHITWHKESQAM